MEKDKKSIQNLSKYKTWWGILTGPRPVFGDNPDADASARIDKVSLYMINFIIESDNEAIDMATMNNPQAETDRPLTKKEMEDVIGVEEFFELWPTEQAALEWYENHRWRKGLRCPRCGGGNAYRVKSGKPMSHRCRDCDRYFSVKIGTPLENSKLTIRKWLLFMHLFLTDRRGESGVTLHNSAKVKYHTSWFAGQRVRAMAAEVEAMVLEGIVQLDETIIGGKFANMPEWRRKKFAGDGMANKFQIIGAKDRDHNLVLRLLPDTEFESIRQFVRDHVAPGSTLWTDSHPAYQPLMNEGYEHASVNHNAGEYVGEFGQTNNSMEGEWGQLKRKYHGVHGFLSEKHGQLYADEYAFRANHGVGNGPRTIGLLLDMAEGRTLPYKKLIGKE